jgi:hypothetical protein
MQALLETTDWATPNHVYLLDGDSLVAYIKQGETEPFYFKRPIKGFSKSGRKFKPVEPNPFTAGVAVAVNPNILRVQGSKPNTWYEVDTLLNTCTCPGYTFRGACKHVNS